MDKHIILIVDDEPNQMMALAGYLKKKKHFQIYTAAHGDEALERVQQVPVEILLTDMRMPVMDGLTACQKIRDAGHHKVPIIAMTANVMDRDRDACQEAGMNDFVPKPIKRQTVFAMIQKWILEG